MADTLEKQFGVRVDLLEGAAGVFDVIADGVTVFSKHSLRRFPEEQEIIDLLNDLNSCPPQT